MTGIESLAQLQRDLDSIERDKAALARIGGNVYRREGGVCRARGYTRAETDEYMASEVRHKVNDRKASRRAQLPESAFDWPIYRAAMTAEVYGALWGQASPAEEAVLDTLAMCAGLPVSRQRAEADRLYVEHRDTELHTGDNYVSGCPTCEGSESYRREGR